MNPVALAVAISAALLISGHHTYAQSIQVEEGIARYSLARGIPGNASSVGSASFVQGITEKRFGKCNQSRTFLQ